MNEKLKRCLDRIAADNDRINAVLNIFEGDLGHSDGPLAGRIIGVKANIAVRGQVWHGGIKAYENQIASKDARIVQRLRDAGAIILANLNMEEGALGAQTDNPFFGKTHNPLRQGYTPGGSSGGSAAAVAAGFVEMALGTDTMGSVRVPSGYCGLWGFKTSHEESMLDGVLPLSPTLDTVGAHGKSLEDVVAVAQIITNQNFQSGQAGEVSILDWDDKVEVEADVEAAFRTFVSERNLTKTAKIAPYDYGKSRMAGLIVSEIEGFSIHEHHMETEPAGFSKHFSEMLKWAARQSEEKIKNAFAHQRQVADGDYADFILMPTTPQVAFKFGSPVPANQADFTAFANLANRPAIAFPIGMSEEGLPISAQLVGPKGREADLVATVKKITN